MIEEADLDEGGSSVLDWAAVMQAAREFSQADVQEKLLARRKKELRDRLYALVEREGERDDKGNLLLPLPEAAGDILTLQIQRRVSNPFQGEVAEEILRERGIWHDCVTLVPVLDEDKVLAARYDGLLSDEDIEAMYPEVESFAFTPVRSKKK